MEKRLVKLSGKWGWYLGEDRKVYKSFEGSGSYIQWDCPLWLDIDVEWDRLFGVVDVPERAVKVVSRRGRGDVGVRMEQIRRKRLGVNNSVGRPSKVSYDEFCEFYKGNNGCSVAFLARKFNISGVTARKYLKKCEMKKGEF